jgi:23S rRNA (uracil1939-C5)-methyltransferase
MDEIYTLELTGLAYGGEAIGRLPDGRAVFVPFALRGEQVRVRIIAEKKGYTRAELVEVLHPSPQRVTPLCAHFGICGGCHYQHLSYEAQLSARQDILRDQLERIGGLVDPPVQPCVPSPQPYHYRNHVQFHLTSEGRLGYYPARGEQVFPIRECHLPEPPLDSLWQQLEFEANQEIDRVGLRLGSDDEVQLILESRDPAPPELSIEELAVSVAFIAPDVEMTLAGSPAVIMEVLGRPLRVSAGSFFQVNNALAGSMVQHVLELFPADPQATWLDLYCGVGLFSAFLAPRCARLVGVESSASACEDFSANLDEFENVELYEAPVEDVISHLAALHPQAILLDPPRAGLDRRVLDGLMQMKPSRLVYVSCDPATLARDAKRLVAGGYRLEQVTPFDMFPQTYHIESINSFVLG